MIKQAVRFVPILIILSILLSACSVSTPPIPVVTPTAAPTEAPVQTEAPTLPEKTAEVVATEALPPTPEGPVACPAVTVADPMGVQGAFPQQFELSELEQLAGCEMSFTDNPLFAADVTAGKLPSLEERLPEEPLVVAPYDEVGQYGGTLRGISLAPSSGTTEYFSFRLATLVRMADDLKTIVPNVAKSWEANDDYTEWTFTLRKGHKWSDGEPFTTEDIAFWYEDVILNPEINPSVPSPWLVGGEPAKLTVVDEQTFKFTFAKPMPGLLTILSITPNSPWAPKHAVTQYHIEYNPEANTLAQEQGFKTWVELFSTYFNKWPDLMDKPEVPTLDSHYLQEAPTTEQRVRVANPYYFKVDTSGQQLPYIDTHLESFVKDKELINLKVINGEVDMKAQSLDLASYPLYKENEQKGNYTIQLPPGFGGMIYAFNVTHPDPVLREIFQDPRFKQAMSLAINREEINELLYFGLAKPSQAVPSPKVSFVEPWMAEYMAEYDPDQANTLLDEMGLEKGTDGFRLRPDGKPLTILLEYAQQAENVKNNELVKDYWEKVGVKVELKELTTEALRAHSATNEMDIGVWSYTFYHEASMVGNPRRLIPSWGDGSMQMAGYPWMQWNNSGGSEGEEPPDNIKQLYALADEWKTKVPGSEEYIELGKQMMQINLDNLYLIGTLGEIPGPTIISNNLGNVPAFTVQSSDYSRTVPFRVDQWYFK